MSRDYARQSCSVTDATGRRDNIESRNLGLARDTTIETFVTIELMNFESGPAKMIRASESLCHTVGINTFQSF